MQGHWSSQMKIEVEHPDSTPAFKPLTAWPDNLKDATKLDFAHDDDVKGDDLAKFNGHVFHAKVKMPDESETLIPVMRSSDDGKLWTVVRFLLFW